MATTSVILLRSINVGGKNKLPMADLRALLTSLGLRDVRTFIQSGNAVVVHDKSLSTKLIEESIAARFSVSTTAITRTTKQLQAVVAANPFQKLEDSKIHVGFPNQKLPVANHDGMDLDPFLPERFEIVDDHLYFFLPNGMARTKLPDYVGRRLKIPVTVRNWNTVNKIVDLMVS